MQRPNDEKRTRILRTAAELFATRAFHEVLLDDVAAAARIGKGTIYTYFAGKDALYGALLEDGMRKLVAELAALQAAPGATPRRLLGAIVRRVVAFAWGHPHVFHLLRVGGAPPQSAALAGQRAALTAVIVAAIRAGIRRGDMADAHPELTAEYLLGAVRGVMTFRPQRLAERDLARHLTRTLERGLLRPRRPRAR